jgi:arsenate reductase
MNYELTCVSVRRVRQAGLRAPAHHRPHGGPALVPLAGPTLHSDHRVGIARRASMVGSAHPTCWTILITCCLLVLTGGILAGEKPRSEPGAFVEALWAVQRFGAIDAADPRHDERTKALLATSLAKDGSLTNRTIENNLMDAKTYQTLAGDDDRLQASEIRAALDTDLPPTRRRLFSAVAAHLDGLTTSFDRIDPAHLAAGEKLAEWIVANYQRGKRLPIIFVCTGNSRRSILGATMGNLAADYWGLPEVRCFSGGTAPSAFNSRTIAALQAIGIDIEPTGEEAERGAEGAPNLMYLVRWGETAGDAAPAMETVEFSKRYDDAANPQSGFAAVMVCTQADAECPLVKGASRRISMPYLDPKTYDGGEYEAAKYAERRDDLGRLMLAVMLNARRQLEAAGKLPPASIKK